MVQASRVYVLFGFNRGAHSDKARIETLELSGTRCVTVSEKAETYPGEHFQVDFKCKGWPGVLEWLAGLVEKSSHPVFAFLDYFWIATHYFEERYGFDWYSHKAPSMLLSAGVSKVFCPNAPEITSTLVDVPDSVKFRFAHRTPLSIATEKTSLPIGRGDNITHFRRLNYPPFIVFELSKTFKVIQVMLLVPQILLFSLNFFFFRDCVTHVVICSSWCPYLFLYLGTLKGNKSPKQGCSRRS